MRIIGISIFLFLTLLTQVRAEAANADRLLPYYPATGDIFSLGAESLDYVESSNIRVLTNLDESDILKVEFHINGKTFADPDYNFYADVYDNGLNMLLFSLTLSNNIFAEGANQLTIELSSSIQAKPYILTVNFAKDTIRPSVKRVSIIRLADDRRRAHHLRLDAADDERGGVVKLDANVITAAGKYTVYNVKKSAGGGFRIILPTSKAIQDSLVYFTLIDINGNKTQFGLPDDLAAYKDEKVIPVDHLMGWYQLQDMLSDHHHKIPR